MQDWRSKGRREVSTKESLKGRPREIEKHAKNSITGIALFSLRVTFRLHTFYKKGHLVQWSKGCRRDLRLKKRRQVSTEENVKGRFREV